MPRKKIEISENADETPNVEVSVEEPQNVKIEKVECGHVNRHSIGLDKKPDNITCDKSKGHSGDHAGEHQEYIKQYDTKVVDGREVTTVLLVAETRRVAWGDMAGIPVKDIPRPAPVAPPTLANLEKRMQQLERTKLKPGQFVNS